MGFLDDFELPEGAAEDIAKQNLQAVQLQDGVTRFMSGHDGGVAYRFFEFSDYNIVKSKNLGYEVFEPVEMIEWLLDRKNKIPERVSRLPEALLRFNKYGECSGGRYKESYMRYKEGKGAIGTPVTKWGILSDCEAASLTAEGIYTVEQFADYPTDRIEGVYPQNFVDAHERAKQFVAGKTNRDQNEKQGQKLAALEKQNQELLARLEELEKASPVKEEVQEEPIIEIGDEAF